MRPRTSSDFRRSSERGGGLFTACARLAEEEPDLVLQLGDYMYEYVANDYMTTPGNVWYHAGPETGTLANFRRRHAQHKTDEDLQAEHTVAPWLVVRDDHEIENNWAVPATWAADITTRFDDPEAPVVRTELVWTSITSGGHGTDTTENSAAYLAENPHIRFFNQRGYVRTRFTASELTADFRVLPYVQEAGVRGRRSSSDRRWGPSRS